jgi:hypothetical protein
VLPSDIVWDRPHTFAKGFCFELCSVISIPLYAALSIAFATNYQHPSSGTLSTWQRHSFCTFVEWSEKTFEYLAFMVNLWFSEQETGVWHYGNPQYTAPDKDWAFNLIFLDPNNLPPGVPRINTVLKVSWLQRIVSN